MNIHFNPEQIDSGFRRLMMAFRAQRFLQIGDMGGYASAATLPGLPTSKGDYRNGHFMDLASEFMFMGYSKAGEYYAFKHTVTRNYLYCTSQGRPRVYVPITDTPFKRGTFDAEEPTSAFVVNDITTACVAAFAVKKSNSDDIDIIRSASHVLRAENQRSFNHQHEMNDPADPVTIDEETLKAILRLNPHRVLGVIRCYIFQACSCPDWRETKARRIALEALEEAKGLAKTSTYAYDGWELQSEELCRERPHDDSHDNLS